jgi:virulence-associated protein VagC
MLTVQGSAIAYRLFDVGYAIDLERALDLLATSAPERIRPVRGEGQALQISNPPITVLLGTAVLIVDDITRDVDVSARIFDFGVVSIRVRVRAPDADSWARFTTFGQCLEHHPGIDAVARQHLRLLAERIHAAIERPVIASVHEDYVVFRVTRITDARGEPLSPEALAALEVAPLLLNETRPLSAEARRELLPHRFSYYGDELAILTWENALVIEPGEQDTDLQYILEFANAQLLELRYYDAQLDAELPRLYDAIEAARARRSVFPGRRFAALLSRLQAQVADSTELVERVENALKVTDDVYLARVYSAALELFRGRAWRAGIDRKLAILRETYAMLNSEAQASRSETLEIAIVLLIVAEIAMAIMRG